MYIVHYSVLYTIWTTNKYLEQAECSHWSNQLWWGLQSIWIQRWGLQAHLNPCRGEVLGPSEPRGSSVHQIPEVRSSVHFLVSDLSDSLTIAHFLWASGANRTWSLIFGELPERFALIAHFWWATWAIHSHPHQKRGNERIAHFLANLTYSI